MIAFYCKYDDSELNQTPPWQMSFIKNCFIISVNIDWPKFINNDLFKNV